MIERCPVKTSVSNYEVLIGRNLLSRIGDELVRLRIGKRVAVIGDARLMGSYGVTVVESLKAAGFSVEMASLPGGEKSKSLTETLPLLSFLAKHKIERSGAVIALGGGVIGDLAGFLAATYLRGVHLVQIPTTLLAMVDSAVGGKTGVNLPEGKNLVGCFHQPSVVLADLDTLITLPDRELAAGMAEVIKYGVIADASLFLKVATGRPKDLSPIVRRCVEIKAQVVGEDERELTGRRAVLNFGHTLGHAVEQAAGYGELLHGEAVGIGMVAAAHLSAKRAGLTLKEVASIESAIAANQLPLRAPGLDRDKVRRAMTQDKKVKAGAIRWVLAPRLGEASLYDTVTDSDVEEVMDLCLT